jgi:hypothetical protein
VGALTFDLPHPVFSSRRAAEFDISELNQRIIILDHLKCVTRYQHMG